MAHRVRAPRDGVMRFLLSLTAAVGIPLMTGCAKNLAVTYYSDPPGAILYQGQQRFGYTPVTLYYRIRDEDRERGHLALQGTQVRWASGASANVPSLRADLSRGTNHWFTFVRPENVPGREADLRFALELEKLELMRRQADAQAAQAYWQMYNAINQQYQQQQRSFTNCTSRLRGNTIDTTCY